MPTLHHHFSSSPHQSYPKLSAKQRKASLDSEATQWTLDKTDSSRTGIPILPHHPSVFDTKVAAREAADAREATDGYGYDKYAAVM